jgi:hypothetical protein
MDFLVIVFLFFARNVRRRSQRFFRVPGAANTPRASDQNHRRSSAACRLTPCSGGALNLAESVVWALFCANGRPILKWLQALIDLMQKPFASLAGALTFMMVNDNGRQASVADELKTAVVPPDGRD